MCEQTEISYLDGDVVWVKLGSCWWPGEVVGSEKLPPDVLPSFRKPPIAVVKFFQEDTYEYVKNINSIYKYNCSRKNEFINKGLYMYRTKHGPMEKFPEDVIRAETAVGGDIRILTRDEFQETKKESYAGLFGDTPKKTSISMKKGKGKGRQSETPRIATPIRKAKDKVDYQMHILLQGSTTPTTKAKEAVSTLTTVNEVVEVDKNNEDANTEPEVKSPCVEKPNFSLSTPTVSSGGIYACHACAFSTTRLNVLILHNKSHSVTFGPYTPTPIKKKVSYQPTVTSTSPSTSKSPKTSRPRKEKSEKKSKKASAAQKRSSEDLKESPDSKKLKTDHEIKSTLLADWDDFDEDSNDETTGAVTAESPETPVAAESPIVPTSTELSISMPAENLTTDKKEENRSSTEKSEPTSDSKYEFCEDEDWPLEADVGRKIPRVKNSSKRKDDSKSVSLEDDDVAREIAELLNKTTVPELPTIPEPLKIEENFPEPSLAKSPDKNQSQSSELNKDLEKTSPEQPTKPIFKTKTFFRSRHSRSQDAIGKYVAEQLNAVERMNLSENEINGSDVVSSPEARESPPIEPVKVARLAPKIQLKKMKAAAAQLREKEKTPPVINDISKPSTVDQSMSNKINENSLDIHQDVLYPTQEIKPINDIDVRVIKTISKKEEVKSQHDEKKLTNISNAFLPDQETIDSPKRVDAESGENIQNTEVVPYEEKENTSEKSNDPFLNETTASAVDALLSVSRDPDRVTKIISDDPPEDLFEDDIRDNSVKNINGFKENEESEVSQAPVLENIEIQQDESNILLGSVNDNNLDELIINTDTPSVQKNSNDALSEETHSSGVECTSDTAESIPTESDLQVAEALINLPSTANQNNSIEQNNGKLTAALSVENIAVAGDAGNTLLYNSQEEVSVKEQQHLDQNITETSNMRFETEQEKSENLNAAQSLVQMSESIDHKINIIENNVINTKETPNLDSVEIKKNNGLDKIIDKQNQKTTEEKLAAISSDNSNDSPISKTKFDLGSSKLLKILEEPRVPRISKSLPPKQIILKGKEKVLNFGVAKSAKPKSQSPVIIRRAVANKTLLNNMNDVSTPEKIILSRTTKASQDPSSIQTYNIQTSSGTQLDANTIAIIPQKTRKPQKTPQTKLQRIKPHNSLISTQAASTKNNKDISITEESVFDINSMPIVLSDDLLTPESIDKMPIVMSDGNLITSTSNTPKLTKSKTSIEPEKTIVSRPEVKTLLLNPVNEVNKVTSPNILSKSNKLRGTKQMLLIDKSTGQQKIIMTKSEPPHKELKQAPALIQSLPQNSGKTEKFIILPTANSSPRPARTQKIVIDPQTGKAHVLVAKSQDTPNLNDNKPVSAKLIPSSSDASGPGNTVMIITNAQGAQSRIVLTSEHEKILFPNKQPPKNPSQVKTITHRITTNTAGPPQKTLVTSVPPVKTQTRIVPKPKNTIITSKGQLIVGGRVSAPAQNIAPMPEIRPVQKRLITTEPKKIIQAVPKSPSESLIFLQQKSGSVIQLTASQFEHFQRTGQIIQKIPLPVENKPIIQKTITISPGESVPSIVQKRIRKTVTEIPTPAKKVKHEIAIAPALTPLPIAPMPALTPISSNVSSKGPSISNTITISTSSSYSDLDHIEEMLPSTAIVRQPEPVVQQPEPVPPASLSEGQLLAVSGENFGGPPGSFYLCVGEGGTLTPIDNRPLILENNQLVPMAVEPVQILPQPERRDILEAALANSDVFHAESPVEAPDFRDLNANVSVHCRVSETSTTLNQPIMTPVELPTKVDSEPAVTTNLEDGLAVIGVTPHAVPTSLELPITVTDPRIAPKMSDPLSGTNYTTTTLLASSNIDTFVTTDDVEISIGGPISMPLLTDDDPVGKSMPSLNDDGMGDRGSGSPAGSHGSREAEDGPRRLHTPSSDTSETSSEIPLQPAIQVSASNMSEHS